MIIKVENLVKRYEDLVALDHFNLEVKEGQILGLLGPNGSGKTTVINTVLGLLKYNKGEIKVFDEKLKDNSYGIKRKIGIVPQELAFLDELTVEDNISYFCGLYINDSKTIKEYVNEAIKFVGLEKFRKFYPKKLSGGLKRRLNIACGISHKPKLLFLDEPTVAVDAQSRNFILDNIKKLNENGATIIYTSHYLEEVDKICDEIVIMDKGKSIVKGTSAELKHMIAIKDKVTIVFDKYYENIQTELENLSWVSNVEQIDENKYQITFSKLENNLVNVINYINDKKYGYLEIFNELPSLNDVFLELTGKELRE
ncbi:MULTISPECIES: ABC transporter ATP-binding protein [Helcococcus]|uniref:ABC transporter ATP-binding protein n=1 Tax=Helcococcus bovis TaxID=3153252 RepID=A0ABW9F4H3_9FIRM